MFLRSLVRGPLNIWNVYGNAQKNHPQLMKFYCIMWTISFFTIVGKGAEKFTFYGSGNQRIENKKAMESFQLTND